MVAKEFIASRNVWWILLIYISAMLLLDVGNGDLWFASQLYRLEGYQWSLQQHWLFEGLLHQGARKINYIFCVIVLLLTIYYIINYQRFPSRANSYLTLSLSLLCSFILVAYLKAITNVACPWDLALFGGTEPYIHLLQKKPSYLPYNQCFPAGHASVGYAWVALYYFFRQQCPRCRFYGLAIGLVVGLVLGFTQQIRGAHFLSHDLTTLVLCLLCAKLCFMVINTWSRNQEI